MGIDISGATVWRMGGTREVVVRTHRVRCGKAMTQSTLFQYGLSGRSECVRCGVEGDVMHYLEDCIKWDAERVRWCDSVKGKNRTSNGSIRERMREANLSELMVFVGETGGEGGVRD